jgi:hypothetical protein
MRSPNPEEFRSPTIALVLAAIVSATATSAFSAEPDGQPCASAYENAQRLRQKGKFGEARVNLIHCRSPACPGVLQADCLRWFSEVEMAQPSIVLAAIDTQGREIVDLRAYVDGGRVADRLDGRAIDVDPGEHMLRLEDPKGRATQLRIVFLEGVKLRKITVQWPDQPSGSTSSPAAESSPAAIPPAAIGLGGLGIVALGSFAYFGITGKHQENDLKSTCAPRCPVDDYDVMHRRMVIADVSLAIGIVTLGAATWIVVARPNPSTSSAAVSKLEARPLPGGGALLVSGSF